MYKLFLQWNREGDWLPTVWKLSYDQAVRKMDELQYLHPEHAYTMVRTLC